MATLEVSAIGYGTRVLLNGFLGSYRISLDIRAGGFRLEAWVDRTITLENCKDCLG
jgi:hypothetical protein